MKLSAYGIREWLTIIAIGVMLATACTIVGWWYAVIMVAVATMGLLSFFRDPQRQIPTQRGVMVSPADGRVSSIHEVEHFEPFGQAAICVRIFLSVLNVHVNRSPCHGEVGSVTHKPGKFLNALNPTSAEVNESMLTVLLHPTRRQPIAAVRQVSGAIARTIVCKTQSGQILQRGERYGMIKFGSTTELYLPRSLDPRVMVSEGQRVFGGTTVLAVVQGSGETSEESIPVESVAAGV